MNITRRTHLTGQIKPSTRNAVLDQLAAQADGIIQMREQLAAAKRLALRGISAEVQAAIFGVDEPIRWWHRFAWWRK